MELHHKTVKTLLKVAQDIFELSEILDKKSHDLSCSGDELINYCLTILGIPEDDTLEKGENCTYCRDYVSDIVFNYHNGDITFEELLEEIAKESEEISNEC